ncbi:hypothetical protein D3C83_211080 [compost metagenome]
MQQAQTGEPNVRGQAIGKLPKQAGRTMKDRDLLSDKPWDDLSHPFGFHVERI